MYRDFHATDRWTKKQVHCIYQALIVAVATRHADAVDIKFLVDGRTVWVALPHPAWVEYKKQTGKMITDALAIEIAGHYLKTALESGEGVGREMYSLTVEEEWMGNFGHWSANALVASITRFASFVMVREYK